MSKKTVENKTGQTISTLIDDLKSEDIRKRLTSVQNLNVIASALGPERTRLELIPFLNELMEDEDEILSAIADSLSNFADFVGGNQNVVVLFNVLEQLCKSDESTVRNKASATLIQLIRVIDIRKNEELLSSLVKRLNETESFFSKGPLSQIIPSFYNGVSSGFQQELNKIYLSFSQDAIPSVKKQASMNLKDFISVASPKNDDVVMNIMSTCMQDEQDFVRLYMVDACTKYLKTEGTQKNQSQVQQYLKSLSEDKSWRIKYYLCDKLGDVAAALGKGDFKKLLFGNYISYLEDAEPELRSVAVSKATIVGAYIDQDDIINKILPIVKTLASDTQSYVRNSVASGFLGLSQYIGKKNTMDLILPILLQLLKDEDSEVRISLFKSLNQITNVLGIDTLSQSIVPALSELAQDKNWRIRASSIDIISFFAKELGQEFLTDKILKILMDWLSDKVYAVREAAVLSVKNVIQSLGWAWSEKNIMPKIISLKDQANYLHRETLLFLIIQANKQINADYINKTLIPTLTSLSKDPIANIRFNVSKCFKILAPSIKDKDSVKKILNALCEDPDFDVKFYAKQALESL